MKNNPNSIIREPARELSVPPEQTADVIVCGGGPAGIAAALAAARSGAQTVLIETHGCLGGIWTAGLVAWIVDGDERKPGIMRELKHRLEQRGACRHRVPGGRNFACDVEPLKLLLEEMVAEAGVRVLYHTRVAAAVRDSQDARRVEAVITESKSGRQAWTARCFVDATGDGDLAAHAGCGFDFGRAESPGETQPMSLLALVTGVRMQDIEPFVGGGLSEPKQRLLAELQRAGVTPSYTAPTEDAHRAACQQWMNNGRTIVYHDCRDGCWTVLAIDSGTGREHVLAENRQLGFGAAAGKLTPLYGCHWKPGAHRDLELVDVETGTVRVAASQPEWVAATFPENGEPLSVFFPVISPDEQRVFFKLSRGSGGDDFRTPAASVREGKFVYDLAAGKPLRFFPHWGHPSWHPDCRHILEKGNLLFDIATGESRKLAPMNRHEIGYGERLDIVKSEIDKPMPFWTFGFLINVQAYRMVTLDTAFSRKFFDTSLTAQTALAVEQYRRKHNALPETLDALVPEFLDTVPHSYMTGEPLGYEYGDVIVPASRDAEVEFYGYYVRGGETKYGPVLFVVPLENPDGKTPRVIAPDI